jgi:hypothetical protein
MLWSLLGLLVPVVIHLWQKRQVQRITFSTLRFLKVAAVRTSRSAKLEHLLLFLARTAVVALLALAAARPIASHLSAQFFGGQTPRAVVLVIDHSFSMAYKINGRTRLEVALDQARAVLDDLKPGDSVAVLAASDRALGVVPDPTVDHDVARKALESITLSEGRSDFGPVLLEARKSLSRAAKASPHVFVFTDGQSSGWAFDAKSVFDQQWESGNIKLVVARTDDEPAPNVAILDVHLDAAFAAPGGRLRGMAVVANFSSEPAQDLLELRVGEEILFQRALDLPANRRLEVPLEVSIPSGSSGRWFSMTASLSGDWVAADDRRHVLITMAQPPRVLVVEAGSGPERLRPGFFLKTAFTAGPSPAPVRTIAPAELDDTDLNPYSAVFLLGLSNLSDRSQVRVDRYLENGGTVAVFAGDLFDAVAWERVEWMPAVAAAKHDLPAERLPSLVLEPQHPLFSSWDAATPFPPMPQKRAMDWKPRSGARALVSIGKGIPFLMYGERGAGKVVVLNASADAAWGGFPLTPAFVPVVQEIGRLSSARQSKSKPVQVGDAVMLPAGLGRDQSYTVRLLPSGETSVVPVGQPLLMSAPKAGIYEVAHAEEGPVHLFSVNVDGAEGDLTSEALDALEKRFPLEGVLGMDGLQAWLQKSRGTAPMWPLLLVLAAIFFGVQSVYANMLAASRSQGQEGSIQTGRIVRRRFGQRKAGANLEGEPV